MASQVGVDDALLHQAREVSGPMSYRELVEPGLRALTYAKPTTPENKPTKAAAHEPHGNPLRAMLASDAADSDHVDLSGAWKSELAATEARGT
jgi:hypothetical protein